jgi:hypothetical protein
VATRKIALGPATAELTRTALQARDNKITMAHREFARVMRLVRQEIGLTDETNINLTNDGPTLIVEVEEQEDKPEAEATGPALVKEDAPAVSEDSARVEGADAP